VLSSKEAQIADAEGIFYGGTFRLTARLRWGDRWTLDGNFRVKDAEAGGIARDLFGGLLEGGRAELTGTYSLQDHNLDGIFQAPRTDISFVVRDGALAGIDLIAAATSRGPVAGGRTAFGELSGTLVPSGGAFSLRQLRITSEGLNGSGSASVASDKTLSGRLYVDAGERGQGSVNLSGTSAQPVASAR